MGKGDKKSRKGKITMGSYGKSRPHHVKKNAPAIPLDKVEKAEKPAEAAKPEKTKKPSA
jgi:30S ribosomal protein S31